MKKIFLSLVLTMALLLSAPAFAVEPGTIVDIAVGDDDFSILVEALTEAGLVETLQGEGPFTVFAPTNAAFAALLADLDITKEELLANRDLSKVLLYHVVSGEVMAGDLSDGMEAETVLGEKITFSIDGSDYSVNSSAIGPADIEASNGVIHVIDKVLVPEAFGRKTIVETALADENFSILVAALQAANLVDALEADGPFTVFAPTNAAFEALLEALGITADDLLGHPDLAKVLLYHVISGEVMSGDLSDGLEAETLNGQKIVFTINNEGAFADDSKISAADIIARNGVIHVIDSVLVPDDFVLSTEDDMETQPGDNFALIAAILMLLVSAGAIILTGKRKAVKQEE